ncbi:MULTISPECIES: PDDEXK family nuclease [Enterococcus]|uniref:hypothetical protein n=1 Tax=Enterococcus TaxID=1350 RepID=UPI00372D4FAF
MGALNILCLNEIITREDIVNLSTEKFCGFQYIEKQTREGIINILFDDFSDIKRNDKEKLLIKKENLLLFSSELMKGEKIYSLCIVFSDWEQERSILDTLEAISINAKEKRNLNDIYSFITPVYSNVPLSLPLKADQDGINYLEFNVLDEAEVEINAKIFNISMNELKKLYNVTAKYLFKQNVRIGIENKKIGKNLKEEFKNYLKVGVIQLLSDDLINLNDYFNLSETTLKEYQPRTFWYKHNGINIFMDNESEFNTETDAVIIDPKKVSVINGAQTLTNFFIAKEELIKEIKTSDLEIDRPEEVINQVLDSIIVKTIFIKGREDLSKTITWGLNNQIPIANQDFIGNSKEVDRLNELLEKYQIKILKTGEVEPIYKGLTPLEFIKIYFIVKGEPGRSKNYNKSKLGEEIKIALAEIEEDSTLLKKIDIALEVGNWWNNYSRSQKDKNSLFLRYGKNYFQSFVIHTLNQNCELDSFLDSDLNMYFEELNSILETLNADINNYKTDNLFEKVIRETSIKNRQRTNISEDLTEYVNNNKESNYSISSVIKKYNLENDIDIKYFRTIPYYVPTKKNIGRVKESFPLPNSTFEEFYKRDGYMKDEEYPVFEQSLLYKELQKSYPAYIIFLDQEKNVKQVKLIDDFSISIANDWKENASQAFNDTKEAFIQGNADLFPKISDEIGFHIRPKAANGNDTFTFSNGEDITRRTFWVNSNYIQQILEKDNSLRYDIS